MPALVPDGIHGDRLVYGFQLAVLIDDGGLAVLRKNYMGIALGGGVVDAGHDEHAPVGGIIMDPELMGRNRTYLGVSVGVLGGKLVECAGKRQDIPFGGHLAAEPQGTLLDFLPVHVASSGVPWRPL